jgi:ATP-binding cassette subfamily B protein
MASRHFKTPDERAAEGTKGKRDQLRLVMKTVPPTVRLLWAAAPAALVATILVTLGQALVPAAIAWVAKLIVDGVVLAQTGDLAARQQVLSAVMLELGLVVLQTILGRGQGLLKETIATRLKRSLSVRVLDKALNLELRHFEDSALYDKMQNARREADRRPLNLTMQGLGIVQNVVTLSTYGLLIASIAPWALPILFVATLPSFLSELRFAGESFRVLTWRAPEGRRLNYLEWILTRDSSVKEVKLFGLGPLVLGRFTELFDTIVAQDLRLARRRAVWGVLLGLVAVGAFYACYAMVAERAALGTITLGDMTFALVAFRQGQASFQAILGAIGGIVEDALFMSNLFAFLSVEAPGERPRHGVATPLPPGPQPIVLDHVRFAYPGREDRVVIDDISLVIQPGEKIALVGENGAGKSTLVKLLLRLYEPTDGAISYGGVDLRDLDPKALRRRFSAVFQDYVRYQFTITENVGVGDVDRLDDVAAVDRAIAMAGAEGVVEVAGGKDQMLGGWFEKGTELSGGQWQKLALARAFMRDDANVLILDEPTAAVDAAAEAELFEKMRDLAKDKTAILISHRFSTVRMADRILVLDGGRIVEQGSHDELVALGGRYARLFELQAKGYR